MNIKTISRIKWPLTCLLTLCLAACTGEQLNYSSSTSSTSSSSSSSSTSSSGSSSSSSASSSSSTSSASSSGIVAVPAPAIDIYSHIATLEMAPVALAADHLYPGTLTMRAGGIPDLFNNSKALVATNADTVALRYSLDNPNLRIVFTVCESYYRIIAKRSAGIKQLSDLSGKNIQVIPQTSAAYFLHQMLGTVGLTENNIQLSSGQGNDWVKNANIHALSAWEPDPQAALETLGADAIVFRNRDAYREIVNLNTTAENLANPQKRAAIVALVRTLIVAAQQVTQNPESVWPIMEKVMGFKQKLIADSWFVQEFKGTLAADLLDVMEKEEVWLANQQNRTPRTRQQLAPLIDASILEEALKAP